MGDPTEGVVGDGESADSVAPVIVAGVTAEGVVVPIQVDADGVVQVAEPA